MKSVKKSVLTNNKRLVRIVAAETWLVQVVLLYELVDGAEHTALLMLGGKTLHVNERAEALIARILRLGRLLIARLLLLLLLLLLVLVLGSMFGRRYKLHIHATAGLVHIGARVAQKQLIVQERGMIGGDHMRGKPQVLGRLGAILFRHNLRVQRLGERVYGAKINVNYFVLEQVRAERVNKLTRLGVQVERLKLKLRIVFFKL